MGFLDDVVKRIEAQQLINDKELTQSKRYLKFKLSTNGKIIGRKWPQVDELNLKLAHSVEFNKLPKEKIDFGLMKLYKSAKITDFISDAAISSDHLVINTKTLDILKNFDLGSHIIHDCKIQHKEKEEIYHVVQYSNNVEKYLNFENSTFFEADIIGAYKADIKIYDTKDFEKKRQTKYVMLKSGIFISNAIIPDIFTITCSNVSTYISSKLANELVKKKLTGFELTETTTLKDK
jgi:hypothetical protein